MSKNIFSKLIGLAFLCCFQSAQALPIMTIKMPGDSTNYTTTVNALFDANIYIDDIQDFGGFDFSLTYNGTKLSALSLTSGSIFGAADTETFFNSIAPSAAPFYEVHFAEAISAFSSLLVGFNIIAPTLLGTIHFKALSTVADSSIDFVVDANTPILSTFDGSSVNGGAQGALITINDSLPAAVPLPTTAILFATGLLALFGLRKKANFI